MNILFTSQASTKCKLTSQALTKCKLDDTHLIQLR